MNYKAYLVECGKKMLHLGLTVETWGNISIRDSETGLVYLTPSALSYDILEDKDIVVLNLDGTRVEGHRRSTIETEMHLGILRSRPEINAVIHTHPIYSQVFALLHETIPLIIDEAAQMLGGPVYCTEYALPGSRELADNVVKALGTEGRACLVANHGAVCIGKDIDMAFKACTVLEMTAQIYQMARAIGEPKLISGEYISAMKEFAANHYGQDKV